MAFLVDDIFLLPFMGIKSIVENVKKAAEESLEQEEQNIMASLADLHRQLERGEIDEKEFDERENEFLDRRETIEKILHPDPPLTKRQRLEKHFPEEFESKPSKAEQESERESIEESVGELRTVVETELKSVAEARRIKAGGVKPAEGMRPAPMGREAGGLEPAYWELADLGPKKPGLGGKRRCHDQ